MAQTPADALHIIEPGWSVVRSTEPRIHWRWQSESADARFDLEVVALDSEGGVEVVESWRGLQGRSHALYAPLERGRRYRVTVELGGGGGWLDDEVQDSVELMILGEAELRAVRATVASLRTLQTRSASLRPELEVLRARVLESYGLLTEAEAVWSALAMMYPQHPALRRHALRLFDQSRSPGR